MPITPPGNETPIGYTISDLCTAALIETGAVSPGDTPEPDLLQWAFSKANDVFDVWSALREYVYSYQFLIFTFAANVNPVLLGPSPLANWYVPQRPVRLESAALILNQGIAVDLPMNVRDKDWWALNQVKNIQTNIPTDVYPDYTYPDATLYFWPVINVSDQVRLQVWTNLGQFAQITDPLGGPGGPNTLPPALRTALKLTLAETLLPGLNRPPNPVLVANALKARSAFTQNNNKPPRITTQDSGMPQRSTGTRGDFNYFTGGRPGGPPQ